MQFDSTVEFWSDPRMPYVETRRACQSRICYKAHSHPTFSIGVVDCGESNFSSSFAQNQIIRNGAVVVIPAHVQHSCNPLPNQAWSYQMLHLETKWLKQLLDELNHDIPIDSALLNAITPKIKPNILNDREIYQAFCVLNATLFDQAKSILIKEQTLITILMEILLPTFDWELIEVAEYYQQYLPKLNECLKENIENLSLSTLSEKMQMSRYSLIRLFKHYFGLTPHAYQLNKKINQARQSLKKQGTFAQLAYDLEFADQSHFQRIFKQYTGVTPKQYYKTH